MRVGADTLNRRTTPFPAGTFLGTLKAEPEDRWFNDGENCAIAIRMVDNSLLEGEKEPGARPKYQSITIVMNNEHLTELEEITEETSFILASAAGLLANLAVAVGEVEKTDDGDVDEFDVAEFIEQLRNGAFDDQELVFVVENRKASKKAKDPNRVYDDIVAFLDPADFDGEGVEAENVDEPEDDEPEDVVEDTEPDDEPEDEKPAPKKRGKKSTTRASKETATSARSRATAAAGKARGRRTGKK